MNVFETNIRVIGQCSIADYAVVLDESTDKVSHGCCTGGLLSAHLLMIADLANGPAIPTPSQVPNHWDRTTFTSPGISWDACAQHKVWNQTQHSIASMSYLCKPVTSKPTATPYTWPRQYDDDLLKLALQVADKLLPAFQTPTGLPYGSVNLLRGVRFFKYPL